MRRGQYVVDKRVTAFLKAGTFLLRIRFIWKISFENYVAFSRNFVLDV